jgi:hypothetical protein
MRPSAVVALMPKAQVIADHRRAAREAPLRV